MTIHFSSLDKQCDLLLDPVKGEVHQTGRYLGDRAIYTCGHGWEIVGAEERVCQANGEWSNQEPYCKKRGKRENVHLVLRKVDVGQAGSFGNEFYLCIEDYTKCNIKRVIYIYMAHTVFVT